MSDLPALLQRNKKFAADFRHGDLPIRPRLSTIVLTCLDARVDPAHILGESEGLFLSQPVHGAGVHRDSRV